MEPEGQNIHLRDPTTGSYAKKVELFPNSHIFTQNYSTATAFYTYLRVLTLPLGHARYNDASTNTNNIDNQLDATITVY